MTVQDMVSFAVGFLRDAGLVGVSVFILVGGARKWWVWGWLYTEQVAETAFWKDRYLNVIAITEKALEVAERRS